MRSAPLLHDRSVGAAVRALEVSDSGPVHARRSRRVSTLGVLGALVARRVARPPAEPLRLVDEPQGRAAAAEARSAVGVGSARRGDTRRRRPRPRRGAAIARFPGRAMVIPKALVVRASVRVGPHAAITSHAAPVQSRHALFVGVARRSLLDRVARLARALQRALGSNRTPDERYVRFLCDRPPPWGACTRRSSARRARARERTRIDGSCGPTFPHAMTPSTVTAVGSVLLVFLQAWAGSAQNTAAGGWVIAPFLQTTAWLGMRGSQTKESP